MKRVTVVSLVFLTVIGGARSLFSPGDASAAEETPIVPEMIGEGVISTPDDEFGGTPSPDGKTLYFDKTVRPTTYTFYANRTS
jgi:hypothetical protein